MYHRKNVVLFKKKKIEAITYLPRRCYSIRVRHKVPYLVTQAPGGGMYELGTLVRLVSSSPLRNLKLQYHLFCMFLCLHYLRHQAPEAFSIGCRLSIR